MRVFENLAELKPLVGEEIAVSTVTVTQQRIDQFAEATGDHQWIHVDPRRAAAGSVRRDDRARFPDAVDVRCSPRTRSSSAKRADERELRTQSRALPSPCRWTASCAPASGWSAVDDIADNGVQVTTEVTIERKGSDSPVCVAESIGARCEGRVLALSERQRGARRSRGSGAVSPAAGPAKALSHGNA